MKKVSADCITYVLTKAVFKECKIVAVLYQQRIVPRPFDNDCRNVKNNSYSWQQRMRVISKRFNKYSQYNANAIKWDYNAMYLLTESQIFSRLARPNSVNKYFIIWLLLGFLRQQNCRKLHLAGPYGPARFAYGPHTGILQVVLLLKARAGPYRS